MPPVPNETGIFETRMTAEFRAMKEWKYKPAGWFAERRAWRALILAYESETAKTAYWSAKSG